MQETNKDIIQKNIYIYPAFFTSLCHLNKASPFTKVTVDFGLFQIFPNIIYSNSRLAVRLDISSPLEMFNATLLFFQKSIIAKCK